MLVSIVIPVYNEEPAIQEILRRVCKAKIPDGWTREVIIIDDGSSDNTGERVDEFLSEHPEYYTMVEMHQSLINHGKGAALRAGFKLVKGDVVLVQDGDLEYNPNDYSKLLEPFREPEVHIVYGTRMANGLPKGMKLPNKIANVILTLLARVLYGQRITDEATGYKAFRKDVLSRIKLKCLRFEFCPEFLGRVSNLGYKIHEVPISYEPRGIFEGKKIRWWDGVEAVWWLFKIRFWDK